ncbi:hypothetical protein GF337_06670, partial [candidate division KSB1 bacterium]|nr:hypothetical protein [candidate division KSB1 bacterium]
MIIIKNRLFIIYIFFTLEFVLSSQCFSSFENVGTNAGFQAMGGAGVANICTPDAIFYNCSGIALSNGIQIALSYCNPFGIKELNHGTFSVSFPAVLGNFGFASKTFGNVLYSENEYFLSYANSVRGKFSYGASVRYSRLEISKYGHDTAIAVDVGFTTSISTIVKWGFAATNINRAKIGAKNDLLPRIFISGFNVKPVDNLYLNFDVYKDTQFPMELHFGMEYSLFERFVLRSGFVTEIASFTAGMGLRFSHFDLDYAFQSHNDLGF